MVDFSKAKDGDRFRRIGDVRWSDVLIGDIFLYRDTGYNELVSERNGKQLGTANPDAWERAEVDDLEVKLQELAKASEEVTRLVKEIAEIKASKSQGRRAAIAKAKADVEDLTQRMASSESNHEGNQIFRSRTTKPEFHVNKKKGVVTALVKGTFVPTLYSKHFANCSPDDVFSEEIGKAISLRRALGLKVPNDYVNAPKF